MSSDEKHTTNLAVQSEQRKIIKEASEKVFHQSFEDLELKEKLYELYYTPLPLHKKIEATTKLIKKEKEKLIEGTSNFDNLKEFINLVITPAHELKDTIEMEARLDELLKKEKENFQKAPLIDLLQGGWVFKLEPRYNNKNLFGIFSYRSNSLSKGVYRKELGKIQFFFIYHFLTIGEPVEYKKKKSLLITENILSEKLSQWRSENYIEGYQTVQDYWNNFMEKVRKDDLLPSLFDISVNKSSRKYYMIDENRKDRIELSEELKDLSFLKIINLTTSTN